MTVLPLTIDGTRWTVERRHELTQLRSAGAPPGRRLLIIFTSEHGDVVRAVVPDDFPAEPEAELLVRVWREAHR